MDDPAAGLLHVDTFGGGVGRQQQPRGRDWVFEVRLDSLKLDGGHPAVKQAQRVVVEAFLAESLFEMEQGLLVLGEDNQPLVVA